MNNLFLQMAFAIVSNYAHLRKLSITKCRASQFSLCIVLGSTTKTVVLFVATCLSASNLLHRCSGRWWHRTIYTTGRTGNKLDVVNQVATKGVLKPSIARWFKPAQSNRAATPDRFVPHRRSAIRHLRPGRVPLRIPLLYTGSQREILQKWL